MLLNGKPRLVGIGSGVAKNEGDAVVWRARCCLNGAGVKVDRVEAYKWLKLATDRSSIVAKVDLDSLILKLSSEEIAAGQRRADQFRIQDPKPRTSAESSGLISDHLVLKGIMGSSSKRLALINSRTFEAGETALVKTTAGDVEVRCLEIGEGFVRIKVGTNAEQVLRLPAH
jgi:TPR repeat protein